MTINLRKIYLYLFSVVGLILMITGSVSLVNLGLKAWVFTQADNYPVYVERLPTKISGEETEELTDEEQEEREQKEQERQEQQTRSERQRQAANAVAQLIVGLPLFAYHWRLVNKEKDLNG
jgi:biopolymer transport protein ExbB/TolQ